MDSWDRVMGPSSIKLPPSLLKASRNSPISARKMYSDDEDASPAAASNALTKTGSFMTYEQFSKQFLSESEGKSLTVLLAHSLLLNTSLGEASESENVYKEPIGKSSPIMDYKPSGRQVSLESLEAQQSSEDESISDDILSLSPPPLNLDGESSEGELSVDSSPPANSNKSLTKPTTLPSITQNNVNESNFTNNNTPTPTPAPQNTTSIREQRKPKKTVSIKIMALQKECGFFSRPPPSLHYAGGERDDSDDSPYNGNGREVKGIVK